MEKVGIGGLDLAKNVIQFTVPVYMAWCFSGERFPARSCLGSCRSLALAVAMEACAGSHFWGREIANLGHRVKLIAPIFVKPFVKRQKNDAADRGGSVCLHSFGRFSKWISASIMPPPSLVPAR